jgi:hypothetical protein
MRSAWFSQCKVTAFAITTNRADFITRQWVLTQMKTDFRRNRGSAKTDYELRWVCQSVCLSVHPHGTTRLALEGFSRNLESECFPNICRENSSFVKIWQELYTFDNMSLNSSILRAAVDKICEYNQNTHFMITLPFFKIVPCGKMRQSTDNNMTQALCMLDN